MRTVFEDIFLAFDNVTMILLVHLLRILTRLSGVSILSQFSFYIITSILLIFEPTFLISELKGKGNEPSRVKLKILQLKLWLEPARLGLITSA